MRNTYVHRDTNTTSETIIYKQRPVINKILKQSIMRQNISKILWSLLCWLFPAGHGACPYCVFIPSETPLEKTNCSFVSS